MGIPSQVEELAWLVKDNLHAKHLVLSIEELFMEFLECPLSDEETLALEPMVSYQRMLLHRLADLFGLAHESVGEGDDRHLVVEKCEDSLIPAVLVSDILANDNGDTQQTLLSRQLLKRDTPQIDGFQTPPASMNSRLPLEERQAAYLAARQRIFSGTWKCKETAEETGSLRPRSDPAVARRMIAHALGKPKVLAFSSPTDVVPAQDLDLQSVEGVCRMSGGDSPGNGKMNVSVEWKESVQQSSFKAAKRMLANALGLPHTGVSPRVTPRLVSSQTGTSGIRSKPREDTPLDSSVQKSRNLTSISGDSGEVAGQRRLHRSGKRENVIPLQAAKNAHPDRAACRIFSQALSGLPDPGCSTDVNRPASVHQRTSF